MARHTGTNLVKLVTHYSQAWRPRLRSWCLDQRQAAGIADECRLWLDDPDWPVWAIPGMIIAGPLWGNFISRYGSCIFLTTSANHISVKAKCHFRIQPVADPVATGAGGAENHAARFVPEGSTAYEWFEFIGLRLPRFWLLVWWRFMAWQCVGHAKRQSDGDLRSRAATGGDILLVIGAGGVFKQVLVDSGEVRHWAKR